MQRGGVVHDLVKPGHGKIRELHLDDRPHALDRRTYGHAYHRVLADRGIDHASRKALRKIFGRLERTPK